MTQKCFLKKKKLEPLNKLFPFPYLTWIWSPCLDCMRRYFLNLSLVWHQLSLRQAPGPQLVTGASWLVLPLGSSPLQPSLTMTQQWAFENKNMTILVSRINSFSGSVAFRTWFLHLVEVSSLLYCLTCFYFPTGIWNYSHVELFAGPTLCHPFLCLCFSMGPPAQNALFLSPISSLICTPICLSGMSLISLIWWDALSLCSHSTLCMPSHTPWLFWAVEMWGNR